VERLRVSPQIYARQQPRHAGPRRLHTLSFPIDRPYLPAATGAYRNRFGVTDGTNIHVVDFDTRQVHDFIHRDQIVERTSVEPSLTSMAVRHTDVYLLDSASGSLLHKKRDRFEVRAQLTGIENPISIHSLDGERFAVRGSNGLFALEQGHATLRISPERLVGPGCREQALAIRTDGFLAQVRTCGTETVLHLGSVSSGELRPVVRFDGPEGVAAGDMTFALTPASSNGMYCLFGTRLSYVTFDGDIAGIEVSPPIPDRFAMSPKAIAESFTGDLIVVGPEGLLVLTPVNASEARMP